MLPCIIFVIHYFIQTKLYLYPHLSDFTFPFFCCDTYSYSFTLKTLVVLCNRGSKKLEIIYPYFLHLIFRQKAIHTLMHAFDAWAIIVFEASYICTNTYTTCGIICNSCFLSFVCEWFFLNDDDEEECFLRTRALVKLTCMYLLDLTPTYINVKYTEQ